MRIVMHGLILVLLLSSGAPIRAHHAIAEFDFRRLATVHGTVRAFQWENPHVWLWVVSDGADNRSTTFAFEAPSINVLTRFSGWSEHAINVGDKVTVLYMPLRNGKDGGSILRITLADGRVLFGVRNPAVGVKSTGVPARPVQR